MSASINVSSKPERLVRCYNEANNDIHYPEPASVNLRASSLYSS